jgi:type IV secretory pathway VirD2 relaxase
VAELVERLAEAAFREPDRARQRGWPGARQPGKYGAGHSRRVIVKASIVRLSGKGAAAAAAHLRYLQRDGTTRDGERGTLYGRDEDAVDAKAFQGRGAGDRHQFRFIVSPEDGDQYEDLKPLTRRLMERMEQDLGTKLDWVAVDHFNTGHPHTHILVRGKDDGGKDLVIAKDYMTRGCASAPSSWSISIWGRALSVRSKPFCGQRWRRSG